MGKKTKQQEPEHVIDEKDLQVFISGIPFDATQDAVQKIFEDCGEIEEIKLPVFQDSKRLMGYGHIKFKNTEQVQQALTKNKTYMGKRYIEVKPANGIKQQVQINKGEPPENCTTVFVKGLPYEFTEDQIGDAFLNCGKIKNVRISYHSVLKHSKGFCYIDFDDASSVKKALKMNGSKIGGRQIFVDFELGHHKNGYKFNTADQGNQKYAEEKNDIIQKKIKKEKKKEKQLKKIKNLNVHK